MLYEKGVIEIILTWSYSDLRLPYLQLVQENVKYTLDNFIKCLRNLIAFKICPNLATEILTILLNFQVKSENFETLYNVIQTAYESFNSSTEMGNYKTDTINCIQSLQFQISKFCLTNLNSR
jgi:hypothetical protein